MEKLSMCRICLVENVGMYVVTNKSLRVMYEKLTDVPFVTEDSRPILACFFCCTKLKQCCRLQRKCLEAEEQLAQMLSENYKHKPLTNQENMGFAGGFIISPIENISIVEEFQIECDAIKQEPAAAYEEQCDVELKVECLSEEFDSEDLYKCFLGVEAHHSASQSEDDVVMETKLETEEGLPEQKQRVSATEKVPDTKVSTTYSRTAKLVTAKQKKNQLPDSKSLKTVENCASQSVTKLNEPVTVHISRTAIDNCAVDKIKEKLHHQNMNSNEGYNCNKAVTIDNIKNNKSVGKNIFKCDRCSREFTRKGDLKRHICRITGEKPFTCDICQRSFIHKQSLHYHITTHTGKTTHKCILCGRSFTNAESLKYHIRTHTGEKPHKCTECQRSFCTKTYLNNHIRTHTGEKPHKCHLCQRSFRTKSHLINHIRAHTGEKPYKCDVCQLCFISSSYLTKHVRIHTGEKPFKCTMCQRSFAHRTSLKYHISTHKKGEKHNN